MRKVKQVKENKLQIELQSLKEMLSNTASSSPTPGGGSIAAIVAAMGISLIEMQANLTLGKKGYESVQSTIEFILNHAERGRNEFINYANKDIEAFTELMLAYKTKDNNLVQKATKKAANVPLRIGTTAYSYLELAKEIVINGNKNAKTDGQIGALNLITAIKSSFLNVKINLNVIDDKDFVDELTEKMTSIEDKLIDIEKEILSL